MKVISRNQALGAPGLKFYNLFKFCDALYGFPKIQVTSGY